LSIVITNPASNTATVTGVGFTDTYPSGMVNSATPTPSISCTAGSTAGTLTGGIAGGNTIGMSGTSIAQNGSCTITVKVTSPMQGNYTNNTGQVTTTNAGNVAAPGASATLSVGLPMISKAFSAASIVKNGNTTLTFTLTNPTVIAMTGSHFTDTYPAGLVNASPLTLGGTCANRAVDASTVAGGSVFNLTGADIPINSSCTVTVLVSGTTEGSKDNTTSGVTTNQTAMAGPPSNTANLLVYAPVTVTKSFSPTSISPGGVSRLSITVTNPNPSGMAPVTGVSFTDNYPTSPANLRNTTTPNATVSCTADSSANLVGGAASGTTLGISAGSIASGGSCTVSSSVTGATAGNYTNTTGQITTANAGNVAAPGASATLNISSLTPPGTTKSFTGPIARNASSTMTILLTNSNASAITGAAFTDTYPSGLVNTASPSGTTTCTGGTVTAVAGGSSVSLSGATIPANGSCTVTVNVTSATPDTYYNNTGIITTTNGGVGTGASGSIQVLAPPSLTKAFSPNPVAGSGTSTLTITLTNPASNTVALTGVGFTGTYPAGMTNTATPGATTTCTGGTVTAAANGNSLALLGASIPVNGSCTVTVSIRAPAAAGEYTNTIAAANITSTNGGSGLSDASAKLSVGEPGITKAFGTSPIMAGSTSVMTITLSNPTTSPMTAAAFTDTYPDGMTNTGTPAGATNCTGGTVTAAANGGSVSLSGGTIPAGGTCRVTVNVTSYQTVTNTIPAGGLTVSGGGSNTNPASAILQVTPPPQATKTFSNPSIATSASYTSGDENIGKASVLTITITNPTSATMNGVAFTDTYPSTSIRNAAASTISCTTGSSGTRTGGAGTSTVGMTGGTLLGNGSCTVTVTVYGTTAGVYDNSTGNITTTASGTGQPATATLTVLTPFTAAKTFSPGTVNVAPDNTTLTITLTNPNASNAVTGIAFTDTYPANLVNSTPLVTASSCGGTITATAGGNSLALADGTIPAGSSCTVTITVEATTVASPKTNPAFTVTSANDGNAAVAAASLTVVAIAAPTVTKTFTTKQITINGTTVLTIAVQNTSGSNITGVTFTDTYPAGSGITNTVNQTMAGSCLTGTVVGASGGNTVGLNNIRINAGQTCTVTTTVRGATAGTWANTTGLVTSSNAASGGPATDTLVVILAAPTATKTFAPILVATGVVSTMTITLSNGNTSAITGVNFADNYPAGLMNATPLSASTTCAGGTVTATAGGSSVALADATIPASGNCTVTVNVTSNSGNTYNNSTGSLGSTNAQTGAAASGTLTVYYLPSLTVVKSSVPVSAATPGQVVTYSVLVTNTGPGVATHVQLSDVLSPYVYWGVNSFGANVPFQLVEGSPPSGVTLGTAEYYSDTTGNWSYNPSSAGGGAPTGYDANVSQWRMLMNGTMNGNNANFILNYKVQVK
jgi:uncharacterized repeat protein (TIGR01451 family)